MDAAASALADVDLHLVRARTERLVLGGVGGNRADLDVVAARGHIDNQLTPVL